MNIDALMERALRERDKANEIIHATGKVIGPHYTGHPQELPDCVRVALDDAWAAEEHRRVTMLADIQALAARAEQSERERDEALARVAELTATLQKIPSLECPCCGEEGAWPTMFADEQPLTCGCPGMVAANENGANIILSDEPCPKCGSEECSAMGRLPLILIAAWSVVVAACGGVPCK